VRLDIRRIGQLKENDKIIGGRTRVKVVKNKMAAPFREAEFDVGYGTGISRLGEVIDIGVEAGIVEKSGSWLSYKDGRLGQGRDAAIRFLAEHPEVDSELSKQILAKHKLVREGASAPSAPAKVEPALAATKPQPAKAEKPATRAAA
jgi:recombination protein RecA